MNRNFLSFPEVDNVDFLSAHELFQLTMRILQVAAKSAAPLPPCTHVLLLVTLWTIICHEMK